MQRLQQCSCVAPGDLAKQYFEVTILRLVIATQPATHMAVDAL
jgi:hypothetical protein